MKKVLLTTVLGLSLVAPMVMADEVPQSIYIDLNPLLNPAPAASDPLLITDIFSGFTTTPFNPTSVYTDDTTWNAGDNPATTTIDESLAINGGGWVSAGSDGTIGTGDSVTDSIVGVMIGHLNPLAAFDAGLPDSWGLNFNYSFAGTAVVAPDFITGDTNYLGMFNSGSISIDFTDGTSGNVLQSGILTADFVRNTGFPINSQIIAEFFGDVQTAMEGVFFNGTGEDFYDVLADGRAIGIKAGANLSGLNNAPVDDNNDGVYERTTNAGSFEIAIIPEPTSIAIMGLGLLGFALSRKRKQIK
jgi:hypothetical protein